jgi:hypothetical protein
MPNCKHCGKQYEVEGTDDGYCDFTCWEEANCSSPELALAEEDE